MAPPALDNIPPELLTAIYDTVLPQTPALVIGPTQNDRVVRARLSEASKAALAFMQVCRILRAQTDFQLGNIVLTGFDLFLPKGSTPPAADQWLHELQRIPESLVSKAAVGVVHGSWDGIELVRPDPEISKPGRVVGLPMVQLAAAVTSRPLFLEVEIRSHKWASDLRNTFQFENHRLHSALLCKKGTPLSGKDCGVITYRVRLGDVKNAKEEARQRLKDQVARVEGHAEHKGCPIRIEGKSMLKGLQESYAVIKGVIKKAMGRQPRSRHGH